MDAALVHALEPAFGLLALAVIPASIIFIVQHFKLKRRELDLEAELHGRDAQARIQAMETRLSAMEGALSSLVQVMQRRPEMMEPPDAPQAAEPRQQLTKVR